MLILIAIIIIFIIIKKLTDVHKTSPGPVNSGINNQISTPATEPQASSFSYNLSGHWSGTYQVTFPLSCINHSGTWTADVIQNGNTFSGTYASDAANGTVSGNAKSDKDFSWSVSGKGGAELDGSVTSANEVGGNFVGPVCPHTLEHTTGTFSGSRQDSQ